MKHLDEWKIFESKLTDIHSEFSKKYLKLSNELLKRDIIIIFKLQFISFLQTKFKKNSEFSFFVKNFPTMSLSTSGSPMPSRSGTYFTFKVPEVINNHEIFFTIYADDLFMRIVGSVSYQARLQTDIRLATRENIIKAISPKQEFLFSNNFFENIWKTITDSIAELMQSAILSLANNEKPNNVTSISKSKLENINPYFRRLKSGCPELFSKIANNMKSSPKELNFLRTHVPILYDEIKSSRNITNQWGTDLQADAGEYGL